MSKKLAKSDRDIDLPDWADDVTPADEVMKKFYAPTGTFKPGPIIAPNNAPPADTTPETTGSGTLPSESIKQETEESKALEKVSTAEEAPDSSAREQMQPEESSLLSSTPIAEQPRHLVAEETPSSSSIQESHTEEQITAQDYSFEVFARKWKRYLYPGQLAVMRTLFELTIAHGTDECFTRYSEIASATKMTRRNCINVMNSLVERGFVKRLEIRNDATGKGIRLRIHPEPLS